MSLSILNKNKPKFGIGAAAAALMNASKDAAYATPAHTKTLLALESADPHAQQDLQTASNGFDNLIGLIRTSLGIETKNVTLAMEEAATYAGLLSGDTKAVGDRQLDFGRASTETLRVVQPKGDGFFNKPVIALEAFNDVDNRTALSYSVLFNFLAANQDELTRTVWPPIVISPEQVGLEVHINVLTVFNGVQHKITGAFEDWNRRNVVRGVADHRILSKNDTLMVPVARAQNAALLIDSAVVPNFIETIDTGVSITTNGLKPNVKINYLGLCQTDAKIATAGENDQRDSIDPAVNLKTLFFKFGTDDVVRFNVLNLPTANFVASTQGDVYLQNLNFRTTSVLLNKDTKKVDGTALEDLAGVVTGDLIVRLELQNSGNINIETGELLVSPGLVQVSSITDNQGFGVPPTDARYIAIANVVKTGVLLGYSVKAFLTNADRRIRGSLVNVRRFTQLFNVPWRAPIAVERPAHKGAQDDASDLQALITTTRIRVGNEAVTALIDTFSTLKSYVDARDAVGTGPELEGLGRYYLVPKYRHVPLDLQEFVQTLKSSDKAEDIQAAIVVKLRDVAARLLTESEYVPASDALTGGTGGTPTVALITDPIIARYIFGDGELRTLGPDFKYKVVSSIDYRLRGKIYMVFLAPGAEASNEVNVLNFGNLIWSPELVLAANLNRAGGYNKETQVMPRYLFVNHAPIGAEFDVSGVEEVLAKVPVDFQDV